MLWCKGPPAGYGAASQLKHWQLNAVLHQQRIKKRYDTQVVVRGEGLQGWRKKFRWEMEKYDVLQKKQERKGYL